MSLEATRAAWRVPGLHPSARLVLLALADHDGPGGAWPSVGRLAQMCGLKDRQVQNHLRALEELGHIRRRRQAGGTERARDDRRPNLYLLTLDGYRSEIADRGDDFDTANPDGVTPTSPRAPGEDIHTPDPDGVQPSAPRSPADQSGVQPSAPRRGATQCTNGVHSSAPKPTHEPGRVSEPSPSSKSPDALQSEHTGPVDGGEGSIDWILSRTAARVCLWREQNGWGPNRGRAEPKARNELVAAGLDAMATSWLTAGHDPHRIISALVDRHTGTRPHAVPYTPSTEPERDPWVPPPGLYGDPGPDGLVPISADLHALNRRRTA